jgi:hypothetical protein
LKTIYKYPLEPKAINYLDLPIGSEVISTQEQKGSVNIYALVDNAVEETEIHEVLFYGTGNQVSGQIGEYKFIGTVSMYNGDLVFHIFARKVLPQRIESNESRPGASSYIGG